MPLPPWTYGLVADAAIFPPGNLPLPQALTEHRQHRSSEYADLVGDFVVSDVVLPDLAALLRDEGADGDEPLVVDLVVTGGAGAIEPAVRWATRAPGLRLSTLEIALRDESDLAHNARRVGAMVDSLVDELADVQVFVEPPPVLDLPGAGWLAALDELALRELPLKFRTGGASADMFPTLAALAASITASLDRELPFKCTAGLHHAVRHTDPATGFEHHGFLNVLLATRACLDGSDVADVLAETDADALVAASTPESLERTRRWFAGFGSCSILEPHDDLVELGLIDAHQAADA